jgi:hypothetical protein
LVKQHTPLLEGLPAYFLIGAVAILFIAIGLTAIPGLARELRFYRNANWDFSQDSGVQIFRQDDARKKFSFMPLGILKLLYYANRLLLMFIVAGPIILGFFERME